MNENVLMPHNNLVQPLLTDLYQITMAYAYWKSGKMNDYAVFDLFFRKNPFKGEFTIFAGLDECVRFIRNFRFTKSDIDYLRTILPDHVENSFYEYLSQLDASKVSLFAVPEGYCMFPKVPLLRVEGPLPVVQLMETTLLNLVNYASLVATNAARFRIAVGNKKKLLEFGLRRAQGPDGGLSASKYCYIGGFDATSNVLAGKLYNIPVQGTHAHAFVNSFQSFDDLKCKTLPSNTDPTVFVDLTKLAKSKLKLVAETLNVLEEQTNEGELAAFVAYAISFPHGLLCLVDTYNVLRSGLPNFVAVALALNDLGYQARGIRLDSGDLAYLSVKSREAFKVISDKFNLPWFEKLTIVASNDINEETLRSLKEQRPLNEISVQGHEIDSFGIGTHLVTCQRQPALGCVFKLVAVNDEPRMKLSEEVHKINLPGRKSVYRLFLNNVTIVDLVQLTSEEPPKVGERILVRHPFIESRRAYVQPDKVEPLLNQYWGPNGVMQDLPTLHDIKRTAEQSLKTLRPDIKRELNPTPYKVSVSDNMYHYLHKLWLASVPIGELA